MHNIKINFYRLHEINPIELYSSIGQEAKYNIELYKKYYKHQLNELKKDYDNSEINCEEKTVEDLNEIIANQIVAWQVYYEPLFFKEKKILELGLFPIRYEGKNLIACEEWSMSTIYKLKEYALSVTDRNYYESE